MQLSLLLSSRYVTVNTVVAYLSITKHAYVCIGCLCFVCNSEQWHSVTARLLLKESIVVYRMFTLCIAVVKYMRRMHMQRNSTRCCL
jgi:hypothetical protein